MSWTEQAIEILRQVDEPFDLAWALHSEGLAATHLGEYDRAHRSLAESLDMLVAAGDASGFTILLGDYADLAKAEGDIDRALRLRGAAATLQDLTGSALEELMQTAWSSYRLEHNIDSESARALFDEGRALTTEQAISYALAKWEPAPAVQATEAKAAPS